MDARDPAAITDAVQSPASGDPAAPSTTTAQADHAGDLGDLVRYIGPNAASYICRSKAGSATGLARWHWPAFLATVPWLFYRKMYAGGLILVSLPVLLDLVVPGGLFLGWTFVTGLAAGLFGKQWYLDHAKRRVRDARRLYPAGPHRSAFLRHAGGTSIPGAVLGCTIEIATVTATLSGLLDGKP